MIRKTIQTQIALKKTQQNLQIRHPTQVKLPYKIVQFHKTKVIANKLIIQIRKISQK